MSDPDTTPPTMKKHTPYRPTDDPLTVARDLNRILAQRRSIRHFSTKPVPQELIEELVRAAGTAPSGANKQPWRFVAVSDPALKSQIRAGAEAEEREFYAHRASKRWLDDLAPLGTDSDKPFLDDAPWLIVIFKLVHDDDGGQVYYIDESVGIAAGMFLAASHLAGLATLTHTPSPMKFLCEILNRPKYERPFLLIPVGYPADDCMVPDITRKPLNEVMVVHR
ncbi:MAG: nitroreductase family protein [Planctomycetes bacterium]|nr:nitroreductase family protein [Planctomycetota bacterium]NOG53563.1 nitroreductase family protein [Planctomycetota bacterium]